MSVELTKNNFSDEVEKCDVPVLIDFWATWCGPCRMFAPILLDVEKAVKGKAKICKVNVDDEQELAEKFEIMNIPTIIIFKDGKIANRFVGLRDKSEIIKLLNIE